MTHADLAILIAFVATYATACTTYAVGRDATIDGSVIVTHSDDGAGDTDSRIAYVPAADHPKGALRPIWPEAETYPRFVGTRRGATYAALPGQKDTEPIGFIPQVEHTFAFYEAGYAFQNECSLSFGESTASAVFRADRIGTPGGTALLSIAELTSLAAERTCSAREAVQLMGDLAEQYGFYGADGGAGEILTVGDKEEAFVFHILSDPSAHSAIWAAQRVPDDHVAVAANMFTIRVIDFYDKSTFLGSRNMSAIARAHGLWDGKGDFDFTRAFSLGEYGNKYYSGRRVWDGYRRFVPSVMLPTEYGSLRDDAPEHPWGRSVYPTTLKPDALLSPHDLFTAHRSHYEGTPFDMTRGVAAGPYGSPDRYAVPGTRTDPLKGAWERSVSIYRTAMSWVAQAGGAVDACDSAGGLVWWAPADASKSVFVPLSVRAGAPPAEYTRGFPGKVDRKSAYWAHRYTQNLAQLHYSLMIVDIKAHAHHWEARAAELAPQWRCAHGDILKSALDEHAHQVLDATWQLTDDLMGKYADGGIATVTEANAVVASNVGYPTEWLQAVGFAEGPSRIDGNIAPAATPGWLERQRREMDGTKHGALVNKALVNTALVMNGALEASSPVPSAWGGLATVVAVATDSSITDHRPAPAAASSGRPTWVLTCAGVLGIASVGALLLGHQTRMPLRGAGRTLDSQLLPTAEQADGRNGCSDAYRPPAALQP